LRIG